LPQVISMTRPIQAQHCRPTPRPLQGTLPHGGRNKQIKKARLFS